MAESRREIELALQVTTANADSVNQLREDIKRLADAGDLAAPAFQKLDAVLSRMGEQAKSLDALEGLQPKLTAAAAGVRELEAESKALGDTLQRNRAVTEAAGEQLARLKVEHQQAKAAVTASRAALDEYRAGLTRSEQNMSEHRAVLQLMTAAVGEAEKGVAEYRVRLAEAANAVKASAAEQRQANAAYQASEAAVRGAAKELGALQREADRAGKALAEAGGDTKDAATAQKALQDALVATRAEVKAQVEITKALAASDKHMADTAALAAAGRKAAMASMRAAAAAEAQGIVSDYARIEQAQKDAAKAAQDSKQAFADAFGALGGPNANAIRAEIERVRAAMDLLARSGALTGRELDAAMKQGAGAVKALERDLREATGAVTMMDRASRLLNSTVGQVAAFFSLQEVVRGTARAFYETVSSVQALQLGLKAIYGSAGTAASQLETLKAAANASGLKVLDLSAAFTKFSAATHAANIPLEDSNALFGELTRVSGLLGLSSAKAEQALEAVGQMASKGTVSLEELRQQLGDALPGATALAAKGLGVTTEELYKLVESGSLSARTFIPALTKALKDLEGTNETLRGSVARVSNAITEQFSRMADTTAVKALTSGLNSLAANMSTVVDVTYGLGKAFLALKFIEYVKGLSLFSKETAVATAETARHTAVLTSNTVATQANTAAAAANAAAKAAVAAASTAAATGIAGTGAALTTAATAATGATGIFARFGSVLGGVGSLLGGLPGLLAMVAVNADSLGTAIGESAARMMGWGKVMDEANRKLAAQAEAEKAAAQARRAAQVETELLISKQVAKLDELRKTQEKQVQAAEKGVQAAKAEGEQMVLLTGLRGDAIASAEAEAQASAGVAGAAQTESDAKTALVATLENELAQRMMLQQMAGPQGAAMQDELDKLAALLDAKRQEAAQSRAIAGNLKIEIAQREIAVAKLRDNSDSVDVYGKAVQAARDRVEQLTDAEKAGLPVKGLLLQANIDLAKMTALYGDAVEDLAKKRATENAARQADLALGDANRSARLAEIQNSKALAESLGNETLARHADINAKRLQIESINAKVQADIAEQKSVIEVTNAKLDELRQQPNFDRAREAELQNSIKLAEAKIAEAKARGLAVKALETEISTIIKKNNTPEKPRDTGGGGGGGRAGGNEQNGYNERMRNALERADWNYGKVGQDKPQPKLGEGVERVGTSGYRNKAGMSSDASGNVIGMMESQESLDRRVAELFGEQFIGNKDAIEAANLKLKLDQIDKYGTSNLPGQNEWQQAVRQKYDRLVNQLQGGGGVAGADNSGPVGAAKSVVNINIAGTTESIETDEEGAQSIERVVRELSKSKKRSSR